MTHRFSTLAVALMLTSATGAQQPGTQDENTAQPHNRHLHRHNDHLPAEHDPARFHTNRVSPIDLPLPGEDDAFAFVVFGDRTGGPDTGVGILKDAVRDTNLIEPDLVFCVGDMIDGYNETPGWMREMREFKDIMNQLAMPWFPVAGNHDTYWRDDEGDETKPQGEHDASYEIHFGPLWYAFEHKDCMFIALYSDEGDPETNRKSFREPSLQRMSDEQLGWLKSILDKSKGMRHVFVFIHHPRWLGGGYGSDWDRVHEALVKAGNVSAVFAGHIHRMRHDARDGIEYVSLATVGAYNRKTVPEAGWLHHFNIVTVRDDRLAMSAIPVGEVMDVREITGDFGNEIAALAGQEIAVVPRLELGRSGGVDQTVIVPVTNTTSRAAEFTIVPHSEDSRWAFAPDHMHVDLEPGESVAAELRITRAAGAIDDTLRPVAIHINAEVLMPGHRYAIPTIKVFAGPGKDPNAEDE